MGSHMSNLCYTTATSNGAALQAGASLFENLTVGTGCFLLDMESDGVKLILVGKNDIWKNQELFELCKEYFENRFKTRYLRTAIENCLISVNDTRSLMTGALQQFEVADGLAEDNNVNKYSRTLEDLNNFRDSRNPFAVFVQTSQSVHKQHMSMLEKLQRGEIKMDEKLKYIDCRRKVSIIIFVATFASVLICSVVAAAVAAPPVAAGLAAASSIPLGSMGKWVDSKWKSYENELKGQKEMMSTMQEQTYKVVKAMVNIWEIILPLKDKIEALMKNAAEFAIEKEGAVKLAIAEIKGKMGMFVERVEALKNCCAE